MWGAHWIGRPRHPAAVGRGAAHLFKASWGPMNVRRGFLRGGRPVANEIGTPVPNTVNRRPQLFPPGPGVAPRTKEIRRCLKQPDTHHPGAPRFRRPRNLARFWDSRKRLPKAYTALQAGVPYKNSVIVFGNPKSPNCMGKNFCPPESFFYAKMQAPRNA